MAARGRKGAGQAPLFNTGVGPQTRKNRGKVQHSLELQAYSRDEQGLPEALADLAEVGDGGALDAAIKVEEGGEVLQLLAHNEAQLRWWGWGRAQGRSTGALQEWGSGYCDGAHMHGYARGAGAKHRLEGSMQRLASRQAGAEDGPGRGAQGAGACNSPQQAWPRGRG